MSVSEYLAHLRSLGVGIKVQGDQLQINAPRGVLTEAIQTELRDRKTEILTFLKQADAISIAEDQPLRPVGRNRPLPLSYQQLRLWQLIQLDLDTAAYNVSAAFRLSGALEEDLLERAISEIACRHEVLRTSFELRGEEPVQIIADQPKLSLTKINLSETMLDQSDDAVQHVVQAEAQRPFDLGQAPLIRTALIKLNSEAYVLSVVAHHIIFDGWSLDLYLDELGKLYQAYSTGENSPLADIPIQYADFAFWQRKLMHTRRNKEQLDYWKSKLSGEPPALDLPLDHPRKSILTQQAASQDFSIPKNHRVALEQLGDRVGGTLFGSLYAVFCTLLFAHTGQEQMLFCSPIANRNQLEIEPLIGYFNNLVVLTADLSGDPSFLDLLGRCHLTTLEAFDNQDIPFQLIADLPNLRSTPLARGLFALETTSDLALKIDGVRVVSINSSTEETYNDFSLYMIQNSDQELTGEFVYRTDLFDPDTIDQCCEQFCQLLALVTNDPEQPLSTLIKQLNIQSKAELSVQSETNDGYVPARNEIEQELVKIWEDIFRHKPIGIRDDFFELGGHSLLAVRLFSQIGEQFDQALSGKTILEAPTIEKIGELLQTERPVSVDESDPWPMVQALKPEGSNPPFFYIGRGVAAMKIARLMKPEQPFYKLDMDRDIYLSVNEMARLCSQKIQEIYPTGICLLGGFCFDGFVAIETARHLREQGREVALVALLETFLPEKSVAPIYTTFVDRLIRKRINRIKRILSFERGHRLRYLKSNFQEAIKWRFRSIKWKLGDFLFTSRNLPLPAFLRDVTRLDNLALQDYEMADYMGRLDLIYAGDEPDNAYNQTEWDAITTEGVEMFFVPQACTHQDIINFNQPHAQIIVDKLTSLIEKVLENECSST